ncbi:MAG: hypothetical protein JW941_13150, partial [Candidatus Coatesbacteria bacterium]|nr:hypothetical protein [Candidatus Coatesbacteria bacterium]
AWAVKENLYERLRAGGILPLELLVPIFKEARAAGLVADIDLTELAIVFRLMCLSYVLMWFMAGGQIDLLSFGPVVVERFLNGYKRRDDE